MGKKQKQFIHYNYGRKEKIKQNLPFNACIRV